MKVAVPSEGPRLDARVGDRLGLSPYLLIVDSVSKDFEVFPDPGGAANGAGMQMVALIIAKQCDVLLAKWCSPFAAKYLSAHGVRMKTGVSGTVAEALEGWEKDNLSGLAATAEACAGATWKIDRATAIQALRSASRQIQNLLPVMVGVIFLAGLFLAFLSGDLLSSVFSGNVWWDALWGASLGSLFAGNPINSYIIGAQLLEAGVSLVAVTAFICAWVSVGLAQLPAEVAALGWRFAVLRNASCFILSMGVSFGIAIFLNYFEV